MSDGKTQDDAVQKLDDLLVGFVTERDFSQGYALEQARAGLALMILRGDARWDYKAKLIERALNGARSIESQNQK